MLKKIFTIIMLPTTALFLFMVAKRNSIPPEWFSATGLSFLTVTLSILIIGVLIQINYKIPKIKTTNKRDYINQLVTNINKNKDKSYSILLNMTVFLIGTVFLTVSPININIKDSVLLLIFINMIYFALLLLQILLFIQLKAQTNERIIIKEIDSFIYKIIITSCLLFCISIIFYYKYYPEDEFLSHFVWVDNFLKFLSTFF